MRELVSQVQGGDRSGGERNGVPPHEGVRYLAKQGRSALAVSARKARGRREDLRSHGMTDDAVGSFLRDRRLLRRGLDKV